jgi:acyl carrier protein
MPDPASDRLLEVYTEYQKTMRKFLESQDQVFSALTGGPSKGTGVSPTEPESQAASASLSPGLQFPEPLPIKTTAPQPAASPPSSLLQSLPEVAIASSVMSSVEQESPFSSQEAMQEFVREILVDRTGYPPELLEFEAHLESDLGIDSIKQVEVLGALVEALPVVPSPDQMQEIRAEARQKQTIQALAGFMLALHAGKA